MDGKRLPNDGNRAELTLREKDALLAKIERILGQMLMLAEVSANGDLNVDRNMLQRTMKRLQARLDEIADELSRSGNGPV